MIKNTYTRNATSSVVNIVVGVIFIGLGAMRIATDSGFGGLKIALGIVGLVIGIVQMSTPVFTFSSEGVKCSRDAFKSFYVPFGQLRRVVVNDKFLELHYNNEVGKIRMKEIQEADKKEVITYLKKMAKNSDLV